MESVHRTIRPEERTTVLQSKLYRAAKRDKGRRFHALHDKVYLPYVLQSAWEAVAQNKGSAGVDDQTIEEIVSGGVPEFLDALGRAVSDGTYRPKPVRRVLIPKPDGRTRPLGIPTVRDRVVQAAVKLVLEPIFEADFEGCSFGFRPRKGALDALENVADHARRGYRWVVDADIEQYFDTLDHQLLMTALRRRISDGAILRLIYRWLKAGYVWEGRTHSSDQGSPQGGVLSPLLANVYLHEFDQSFHNQREFHGRLTRYADDFVIQCGTQSDAEQALAWSAAMLERLKLRLHSVKTRVVNDRESGFDFLGFHHHRVHLDRRCGGRAGKESHGLMRWPSAKAQHRFRERIRELVGPCGLLRPRWQQITKRLRQYLGGWSHYFRHGQSSAVFGKLDYYLHIRMARSLARGQPTGKHRMPRTWEYYVRRLAGLADFPTLMKTQRQTFPRYGSSMKGLW